MSTHSVASQPAGPGSTTSPAAAVRPSYLTDGHSLKSWLLTVDHKRIAILYLLAITVFFPLSS